MNEFRIEGGHRDNRLRVEKFVHRIVNTYEVVSSALVRKGVWKKSAVTYPKGNRFRCADAEGFDIWLEETTEGYSVRVRHIETGVTVYNEECLRAEGWFKTLDIQYREILKEREKRQRVIQVTRITDVLDKYLKE